MAFLGQDPVRCKIFMDNKCLREVKILNISVVIFSMKRKKTYNKTIKIFSNSGNFNNTSKQTLAKNFQA
jgi:hypothetical protein